MIVKEIQHKEKFHQKVHALTYNRVKDREERIRLFRQQIDIYITVTGETPDKKEFGAVGFGDFV